MRSRPILAVLISGIALLTVACSNASDSAPAEDPTALATQLIDEYAVAVFDRDQEALAALLSEAYLLRRSDGTGYDRDGYVAALAEGSNYELVDYVISDVEAKQDGDILVATFTLDAEILEDGRSVVSEPTSSLVTFVRVEGEWKLASDAFFSK
jgi:ketosteroid isomerase-like protein